MTTTVPASMIGAFVTPETYGAIGNGSIDDTSAMNAAATAAGGGASNTGALVRFNRVANETIGVRVAASVPSAIVGRNVYINCGTGTSDSGSGTTIET